MISNKVQTSNFSIQKNLSNIQTENREHNIKIKTQHEQTQGNSDDSRKVATAVEKMNEFINSAQTNLKFVFHEELNEYYVTVINPLTNEVLKEIPPKKILDMYAAMTEFLGLLVDEKR